MSENKVKYKDILDTCPVFCPKRNCKKKCRRPTGHEKGFGATRHKCMNFDTPHEW